MTERLSNEKLEEIAKYNKQVTMDCNVKVLNAMATELLDLRADAETSQNHNAAVIDRIVDQLREAGYHGTLSEMVDDVLETPDPRADLFCFKPDESGHWYCIPVEHVKEFESWVYDNNKEVNFEEYRLGSHISRYIFRNPVEVE